MRRRLLVALIIVSALFATYLPSSIGGAISRPLSIVSIAGSCVLLGTAGALAGAPPALNLAAGLAVVALPALFTITSPFEEVSPGVVFLYVALGLLFMLDLRLVRSRAVGRALTGITVVSLVLGYALAANLTIADQLASGWYNAFYPALLHNMVLIDDKPVLTYATHSMAGFMMYLLFYLQWHAWRADGRAARLFVALALLGLLVLLRSTTGQLFAVIAAAQFLTLVSRVPPRIRVLTLVLVVAAGLVAAIMRGLDPATVVARVTETIVGDRVRGLFSRYAVDGLLASSFRYLAESPLSPIGFSATTSLYLGDSGVIVNLLRGSVPLVAAVYGGLWVFLRTNLRDPRSATWLWACTVLFEVAFTPLQYFRFVAFLPLFVVAFNSVTSADVPDVVLGDHPAAG